jgi:plastocyanin
MVFALLLATAGSSGGVALAKTIRIEAKNLVFSPAEISARVGDTVEWVNKDFVAHTATAANGDWDVQLPPGGSGRAVLKKPGEVAYTCRYHPNMKGKITVAP